jgi:excisionase family DNA binding protein
LRPPEVPGPRQPARRRTPKSDPDLALAAHQGDLVFLTVREIADATRLCKMTIYWHIESGKLEARKFGRSYRIPVESARAYLKNEGYDPLVASSRSLPTASRPTWDSQGRSGRLIAKCPDLGCEFRDSLLLAGDWILCTGGHAAVGVTLSHQMLALAYAPVRHSDLSRIGRERSWSHVSADARLMRQLLSRSGCCLRRPVTEPLADGQGLGVPGSEHSLESRQQSRELIASSGRIPGLPCPAG